MSFRSNKKEDPFFEMFKTYSATIDRMGTDFGKIISHYQNVERAIADMKTMGSGVTKIEPASGFAAQTSSALVIECMTFLGAPVSTTQIITTSIMGTGTARRISAVKWGVAGNILTAWIVTLPVSMVLGGITSFVLSFMIQLF